MINVIICTYNPKIEFLKRTVNAILNQNLDKSLWDLTIIDNNSKDSVGKIDFIKKLDIKVVSEPTPGLTAARKCAAKIATGDIIVFVDDDNILNPDYLSCVNEAFNEKEIGVLSGAIFPEYLEAPQAWILKHEEMLAIRRLEGDKILFNKSIVCNSLFPIGAGMSIRRDLFVSYFKDPINENNLIEGRKGKELSSGEDIDLDYYALYKGYKIGSYPKMKMLHILPPNRLDEGYLTKLAKSSLKSSIQINSKWAPIFKQNVFDFLDFSRKKIMITLFINSIGGIFDHTRRIRFNFFLDLYKIIN